MALGVHLVRAGLGVVGAAVLLSASAVVVAGSSAAAATNLIANGSFESGGSYSFAGWKTQNATQAGVDDATAAPSDVVSLMVKQTFFAPLTHAVAV